MAERSVVVRLTAQAQGYIAEMEKAAKATRETGSAAEKLGQQKEAFTLMGRAAMVGGGTVMAGLAMATKAAIDWDSAWAGVTKTVDGSPEQLAAVEAGLRGLTSVLPASHEEIAAVAEAAGQLGIATPQVVDFTRTMIDLGETTNLSSEQAAMSLARFMNIMQTSQSDVASLGAALVGLGNNYATTESEILEMSMRLAKSGVQVGLSEGEVLGLATALSSVGIEAEAGGSAMSKVMIDIAASVEKGGSRLELFAKTAGMSADQFAQKWKSTPAEALAAFVKGLANAEQQGGSTLGVLAELGITEVRMRDALLGSAAAADQFTSAMAMGNDEFEKGTALTDEAAKRYETTAAKLSILKNQVVDATVGVGEQFLPAIESAAEGVGQFATAFTDLSGPMQSFVAWGGLIAGTGILGAGIWMAAIPKIAEYKAALESLDLAGSKGVRTLGQLGRVVGALGVALAAKGAVEGFAEAISKEFGPSAEEVTNKVLTAKSAVETFSSAMQARMSSNADFTASATQQVENLAAALDYAKDRTFWDPRDQGFEESLETWRIVAKELAATDFSNLSAQFSRIAEDTNLSRDQLQQLISESPELSKKLTEQATLLDLSTDKSNLLAIALGEVGPAAEDAAAGSDANADALDGLQGSAAATQEAISALADEIAGFGSATFDMRDANRALEESYDTLAEKLAASGLNFDISTSAGRDNEAALDSVAEATNRAAAGILQATNDQDAMNAKLAEGRNALIDILAPYFESRDAAAAYVDQLNLISPQKVTEIVAHTQQAVYDLDTYIGRLNSIPSVVSTEVRQFQALIYRDPASLYENANGGMYAYANGGVEAYANGGFPSGIYKGGTPIHKFAEPETLWEAYISGKPSERDRNRQIWVESGERLGIMKEVRAALAAAAGGGRGVSIGSVQFTQPSQRSQLRDLEDTMHRIERGL